MSLSEHYSAVARCLSLQATCCVALKAVNCNGRFRSAVEDFSWQHLGMNLCMVTFMAFKGEVRRKMNFMYVLGFVVLRDVVKVFPVSSPSFARKMTGRNQARSHSGA